MRINKLSEDEIEVLETFINENPQFDDADEKIQLDDLQIDSDGNIEYLYTCDAKVYFDEDSKQSTTEYTNHKYVILMTKKQLEESVKSNKQNA